MIVHICTAKQEYVTELPDTGLAMLLGVPIEIEPRKTAELFRVVRAQQNGSIQQGIELIPMQNTRTDYLNRLPFTGGIFLIPISVARLNELGPFAKSYYQTMGNSIIPAVSVPGGNGKGKIHGGR